MSLWLIWPPIHWNPVLQTPLQIPLKSSHLHLCKLLQHFIWSQIHIHMFVHNCKATPNKFPVFRPPPASPSWSWCGPIIRLLMTPQTRKQQVTSAMRPRFQGKWQTCWAWQCDLCCSKTLMSWTVFELGDNRMSLREFYHHWSTC